MSVDMRKCKEGDRLITRDGLVCIYKGASSTPSYPHIIAYPNGLDVGTRTDDGKMFLHSITPNTYDIVGFAPALTKDIFTSDPSVETYEGLKEIKKYAVIFWDSKNGWTCKIADSFVEAIECRGFGNFAGFSEVNCVVPINT